MADTVGKLRKAFARVIEETQTDLHEFLKHGALSRFADQMFSAGFIFNEVHRKADFNDMIGSFKAAMKAKNTQKDLEEHCCKFLKVLDEMENDTCDDYAKRIVDSWVQAAREQGVTLKRLNQVKKRFTVPQKETQVPCDSTHKLPPKKTQQCPRYGPQRKTRETRRKAPKPQSMHDESTGNFDYPENIDTTSGIGDKSAWSQQPRQNISSNTVYLPDYVRTFYPTAPSYNVQGSSLTSDHHQNYNSEGIIGSDVTGNQFLIHVPRNQPLPNIADSEAVLLAGQHHPRARSSSDMLQSPPPNINRQDSPPSSSQLRGADQKRSSVSYTGRRRASSLESLHSQIQPQRFTDNSPNCHVSVPLEDKENPQEMVATSSHKPNTAFSDELIKIHARLSQMEAKNNGQSACFRKECLQKDVSIAELKTEIRKGETQLEEVKREKDEIKREKNAQLEEFKREKDEIKREKNAQIEELKKEKDEIKREKNAQQGELKREIDELKREIDELKRERDEIKREKDAQLGELKRERDEFNREKDEIKRENAQLEGKKDELKREKDELKREKDELKREKYELKREKYELKREKEEFKREKNTQLEEFKREKDKKDELMDTQLEEKPQII